MKHALNDPTIKKIKAIALKYNMDQTQMALYLGVPKPTLVQWFQGNRKPSSSVARLIEVMGILETLAPAIHAALLPKQP